MKKTLAVILVMAIILSFAGCSNENAFAGVEVPDELFLGLSVGMSRDEVLAKVPQAYEDETPEPGTEGTLFVEETDNEELRHTYTIGFDENDKVYTILNSYRFKNTGKEYTEDELKEIINGTGEGFLEKMNSMYGEGECLNDIDTMYEWKKDGVAYNLMRNTTNTEDMYGNIMVYCVKTE